MAYRIRMIVMFDVMFHGTAFDAIVGNELLEPP
jgi:hypothetical protein